MFTKGTKARNRSGAADAVARRRGRWFGKPFLSIVTRTLPRRHELLALNRESVQRQSSKSWEQWLLTDREERGILYANGMFAPHRHLVRGRYVLMLDDDNRFAADDAIRRLQQAARLAEFPDIVMFRSQHGPLGVLPGPQAWNQLPVLGQVDTCNFIVTRALWQTHIAAFAQPLSGDFAFLDACWSGASVVWLGELLCEVQQIGALTDRRDRTLP